MPESDSYMQGMEHLRGAMSKFQGFAAGSVQRRLEEAAKYLLERMKVNASLTEYSLRDLRRLGHPYAKRSLQNIHQPAWLVHTQTGDLLRAMGYEKPRKVNPTRWEAEVYIDTHKAPHALHVIFGTSTMAPRDFVRGTVLQEQQNMERGFQIKFAKDFGAWKGTE